MSMWEPDVIRLFDSAGTRTLSVMGSTGFVGARYCAMYPDEAYPEPSRMVVPLCRDVLMLRSTVDNYAPQRGDLTIDIEVNLLHLMRVLDHVAHMQSVKTFTFISSWFCYGFAAGTDAAHPARETDPCDPNGTYSITKLAAEKMVRSLCQTWGVPYRILRLCNVIGNDPRASKTKNALGMMLAKVKRGEDVEVYTGDNHRSILHVDDVCRAIHTCLHTDATLNGITNIGGPSVRIIDLIYHAIRVTGSKSRVTLVAPPRFHTIVQVPDFWMDTTKLRGLGFVPDMTAYEAVERVLSRL